MFLLNTLKDADVIFFIVCISVICLIIGIYFLIPVFNKKQYKDQRDRLRKREATFRANLKLEDDRKIEEEI